MNRRQILLAMAGTGLAHAANTANATATPTQNLVGNKLLDAYVRLSGSFDDRLIIWWMDGKQYAVVNGKSQALFGMKVGMFHRFFQQTDGNFKVAFFELTYFTDLDSGVLLKEFKNPFTGKTNRVRHTRLGPEVRLLTMNGLSSPDNPMVKQYSSSLGPARIINNQVWVPTSVEGIIKFPKPTAPEILLSIYTTINGNLSDALDRDKMSVPCSLAFNNTQPWIPWMGLKDHPGHLMGVANGCKMEAMEELPEDYLACAREVHPRYINDPIAALSRQTLLIREST